MRTWFGITVWCACAGLSFGQAITFAGAGNVTQTFDSLSNTGTTNAFSNGTTITGLFAFRSVGPAAETNYRADNGGSNTGAIYSYGTTAATERAFGSAASGTPGNFAYGLVAQNTSA